ncbi:PH domain-containing protein [Balneolaceae bacterium ANBcel3]|nr:PH domain-containing protein [Balneolaceae bacterium ANBcel3]
MSSETQNLDTTDPLEATSSSSNRDEFGRNTLPPKAIRLWQISGGLFSLLLWIAPAIYTVILITEEQTAVWPLYLLGLGVVINSVLQVAFIPQLRWKYWRYRVDEHEIELQRGLFVRRQTLIPIKRVQHVDTRQGPLYRFFDMAAVTISTAGDIHEIPALTLPVADELRKTISKYARIAREDL